MVEPVPGSVRFSLVFEPAAWPIATRAIASTSQTPIDGPVVARAEAADRVEGAGHCGRSSPYRRRALCARSSRPGGGALPSRKRPGPIASGRRRAAWRRSDQVLGLVGDDRAEQRPRPGRFELGERAQLVVRSSRFQFVEEDEAVGAGLQFAELRFLPASAVGFATEPPQRFDDRVDVFLFLGAELARPAPGVARVEDRASPAGRRRRRPAPGASTSLRTRRRRPFASGVVACRRHRRRRRRRRREPAASASATRRRRAGRDATARAARDSVPGHGARRSL